MLPMSYSYFAERLRRFSPNDKMPDNTVPHFAMQLRA